MVALLLFDGVFVKETCCTIARVLQGIGGRASSRVPKKEGDLDTSPPSPPVLSQLFVRSSRSFLDSVTMAPSLYDRLNGALPKDIQLTIHHCAAQSTSTDPLFVAAPGAKPEPTELESHFLSASIRTDNGLVQAFAIEVLAYTTATLTTLFVSKADSTGYLHLLDRPAGTASTIRVVITQFLIHLIEAKRSTNSRLVLSLFARAQDQYLFPGSIENSRKHVLDERALIKWWARILDGIFAYYKASDGSAAKSATDSNLCSVRGHVVVPGIDAHEARTFIPRDAEYKLSEHWQVTDPLAVIGKPEGIPERCLIPRFPDDPKARFAIDLDDELPESEKKGDDEEAPNPVGSAERWRSVRSLAQFWELMSFRQECSAGRLVGFLWGIFEPPELVGQPFHFTVDEVQKKVMDAVDKDPATHAASRSQQAMREDLGLPTPASSQQPPKESALPLPSLQDPVSESLTAPTPVSAQVSQTIAPQVQTPAQTNATMNPENVPPPVDVVDSSQVPPLVKQAQAEVVLAPDSYSRAMALLLTLDYCDLPTAIESTKRLLHAVEAEAGQDWGIHVAGTKEPEESKETAPASEANSLAGLIRKRPKAEANTLSAGLIRKKPKQS